jgi:hypothetical protein
MKRTYFDISEELQKRLKFRALEEDLPLMHGPGNIVEKAITYYLDCFDGKVRPVPADKSINWKDIPIENMKRVKLHEQVIAEASKTLRRA